MLGMMNAGGDTPADFFSPIRPSSLFNKQRYLEKAKESLSYTSDGRILIDGHPTMPEDPEELWNELIMRVIVYKFRQRIDKNATKSPPFWKRLSTKLVKRSVSVKGDLILNSAISTQFTTSQPFTYHEGYITTIKVSSPSSPTQEKISFSGRRVTT